MEAPDPLDGSDSLRSSVCSIASLSHSPAVLSSSEAADRVGPFHSYPMSMSEWIAGPVPPVPKE